MPDITITLQQQPTRGRYEARVAGIGEPAEMTFSRAGDDLIIVDHTDVPDAMRGLGVGKALARRVVDDARAQGLKIVPLCPFFKAESQKHADWADVLSA